VLHALVASGNTVVAIEHNVDVIKTRTSRRARSSTRSGWSVAAAIRCLPPCLVEPLVGKAGRAVVKFGIPASRAQRFKYLLRDAQLIFGFGFRKRAHRCGASRDCSETHLPLPPALFLKSTKGGIRPYIGKNPENRAADKNVADRCPIQRQQ
jgi:hypothetical protein